MVGQATTLAPNQPYPTTLGLAEEEMIQRFANSHPLYRLDNANVYAQLMIAALGSQYASNIDPFKIVNNSRGEINVLKSQFSGAAHWDIEVKLHMYLLFNGNWNGRAAITVHNFLAKHRASFHFLLRFGDYVTVEIPSELMRVGNMLENIECNDKDFLLSLSAVCLDYNGKGIRNKFERAVAFLLPTDPANNKKKRGHAHISYVSTPSTSGKDKGREKVKWGKKALFKLSTRKTGVELRY